MINCHVTLVPMMCTNEQCKTQCKLQIINGKMPKGKVFCDVCGFKTMDTHLNALLLQAGRDSALLDAMEPLGEKFTRVLNDKLGELYGS